VRRIEWVVRLRGLVGASVGGRAGIDLKIDARRRVVWKTRVDPPEQLGTTTTDRWCGARRLRVRPSPLHATALHHDFGFLNGPLLVEADDGVGGARELVVSGSKGRLALRARRPMARRCGRAPPHEAGDRPSRASVIQRRDQVRGEPVRRGAERLRPGPGVAARAPDGLQPGGRSTVWQDEISLLGQHRRGWRAVVVGTNASAVLCVYDATTGTRLAR
jgi:hypothetical protein